MSEDVKVCRWIYHRLCSNYETACGVAMGEDMDRWKYCPNCGRLRLEQERPPAAEGDTDE